jgi:hypothetical protein
MKLLRSLSILLLCVWFVNHAYALPSNEVTTEFYKEAQHQTLVGERILSCSGGLHAWGQVTRFTLRNSEPCGLHHLSGSVNAERMLFRLHGLSCEQKCARRFPLRVCGPDEADCDAGRLECIAACKPPL